MAAAFSRAPCDVATATAYIFAGHAVATGDAGGVVATISRLAAGMLACGQ